MKTPYPRNLSVEEVQKEIATYGKVRTDAEVKMDRSKQEMRRVGQMLRLNEDGKLLLSMLEDSYYKGDLVGEDPHKTYFNLGRRDVVDFLLGLRDQAEKEK